MTHVFLLSIPLRSESPTYETCLWVHNGACQGDLEPLLALLGITGAVVVGANIAFGGGGGIGGLYDTVEGACP